MILDECITSSLARSYEPLINETVFRQLVRDGHTDVFRSRIYSLELLSTANGDKKARDINWEGY